MKNEQIQGFESNGSKPTVAVPNQLSDLIDGNRVATNEQNIATLGDILDKVPNAPTTDGTYVLKVVVSNGTPTYQWVLES